MQLRTILLSLALTLGCTDADVPAGQCLYDSDCAAGSVCAANYCRTGCHTDRDCPATQVCRESDRVGVLTCHAVVVAAECSLSSDCPDGLVCLDHKCRAQCQSDYDCQVINPFFRCASNACVLTCAAGTEDCDNDPRNGCEVDTTSDPNHCGACATACAVTNGRPQCNGGTCAIASCNASFDNCDGQASTGCEARIDTSANCGACGHACSTGMVCSTGECMTTCAAGTTLCGTSCIDTRVSTTDCGTCGNACPARANAATTCAASTCGFTCNTGFGDCDGATTPGCEARLDTITNCGACGHACTAGMVCSAGECTSICTAGTTFCGASCIDTRVSTTDCGTCGNACPARANAATTCAASTCGFTCNTGFGDCDGATTPGCEAHLDTITNCGTCGHACTAGDNATPTCTAGACGSTCNPGFHNVEGVCIYVRPPTLVSPASLSTTTGNRNVVFNVALGPGTDGASIQLCADRACVTSVITVAGTSATITIPGPITPGVYFWRAYGRDGTNTGLTPSTQTWEVIIPAGGRAGSGAWGTTPDFNGDGYADVAVGEPRSNRVLVYAGAPAGLAATPTALALSGTSGVGLGNNIAVGDFNGDGYADLATVATSDNAVYVFSGSTTGIVPATAPRSLHRTVRGNYANGITAASDLNHDGYADLAVSFDDCPDDCNNGMDVYFGSATGLSGEPTTLFAPDGYDSFRSMVGAGRLSPTSPYESIVVVVQHKGPSTVYVFTGNETGIGADPAQTFNTRYDANTIDALGDLDGDGAADVGVVQYTGVSEDYGVTVYRGGAAGLVAGATVVDGSNIGSNVAGLGDVNGDGLSDFIAGNGYDDARLFFGAASGTPTVGPLVNPPAPADGGFVSNFGAALVFAGDINRDGRNDILVGMPDDGESFCAGQVFVYLSPLTFPTTVLPSTTLGAPGGTCYGGFGTSLASLFRTPRFAWPS